jgi:hypothetical protein
MEGGWKTAFKPLGRDDHLQAKGNWNLTPRRAVIIFFLGISIGWPSS